MQSTHSTWRDPTGKSNQQIQSSLFSFVVMLVTGSAAYFPPPKLLACLIVSSHASVFGLMRITRILTNSFQPVQESRARFGSHKFTANSLVIVSSSSSNCRREQSVRPKLNTFSERSWYRRIAWLFCFRPSLYAPAPVCWSDIGSRPKTFCLASN